MGRFGGKIGGALGVASMIPFMAQDEQGKFMGMDANMLGTGMMVAGMGMPLISKGIGALAGGAIGGGAAGGTGLLATAGGALAAAAPVLLPVAAAAARESIIYC